MGHLRFSPGMVLVPPIKEGNKGPASMSTSVFAIILHVFRVCGQIAGSFNRAA
jgi:hypothetical protein